MTNTIPTSIVPWLSVKDGARATEWYQTAFGAIEVYRLEIPDGGLVVRLSVQGAEFWISGESSDGSKDNPQPLGGGRFG
jgi:PhnB protein